MHKFYTKKTGVDHQGHSRFVKLPLASLSTLITIHRNMRMPLVEESTGWRDWLFVAGFLRIESAGEVQRSTAVVLAKGYYVKQVITLFMIVKRLNISLGRDIRALIFKVTHDDYL